MLPPQTAGRRVGPLNQKFCVRPCVRSTFERALNLREVYELCKVRMKIKRILFAFCGIPCSASEKSKNGCIFWPLENLQILRSDL